MVQSILTLAAAALMAVPCAGAQDASITKTYGIVQVREPAGGWRTVERLPARLVEGGGVRTGSKAGAVLALEDGSRIELGPDTSYSLDSASRSEITMRVSLGRLRAWVERSLSRRFVVGTPTAVCSVRGTEFLVSVAAGGRTTVDLYKGLLGVEDRRGHQLLMHPNERLRIDLRGMGVSERTPSRSQSLRQDFHAQMSREVALDMRKEEVLAAAAREIKLAEYQQGKALIDVNGLRVRLEEYILRPRADQFKLVVLNHREGRLDYFYYLGTFNKSLPLDLSAALRQIPGGIDAPPEYYLTAFETGRSNTQDSLRESAQGGHLVDLNGNADLDDNVSWWFDSATDRYIDVNGRPFYSSLFDRYGFYLNGKLKYGWRGTGITSYSEAADSVDTDPLSGAALDAGSAWLDPLTGQLAFRTVNVTFPDSSRVHQRIYESYSDGSYTSWDNYVIDNEGRTAAVSDFSGLLSGTAFRQKLLDFNYEQVITASEFGGRKIDLVIEPKILIQSGLLK
jgi:hypothetical protein